MAAYRIWNGKEQDSQPPSDQPARQAFRRQSSLEEFPPAEMQERPPAYDSIYLVSCIIYVELCSS